MISQRKKLVGHVLAFGVLAISVVGCRARVYSTGPGPREAHEECRTVTVRNKRDLETCTTRCGDEGCRTRCHESARYSRERRCWVE